MKWEETREQSHMRLTRFLEKLNRGFHVSVSMGNRLRKSGKYICSATYICTAPGRIGGIVDDRFAITKNRIYVL